MTVEGFGMEGSVPKSSGFGLNGLDLMRKWVVL